MWRKQPETVETVSSSRTALYTRLKPGVNESFGLEKHK
jgi:hypothetical protein